MDLEREKERLDQVALKKEEAKLKREKQRHEIASRMEWLKVRGGRGQGKGHGRD